MLTHDTPPLHDRYQPPPDKPAWRSRTVTEIRPGPAVARPRPNNPSKLF